MAAQAQPGSPQLSAECCWKGAHSKSRPLVPSSVGGATLFLSAPRLSGVEAVVSAASGFRERSNQKRFANFEKI